MTLLAPEIDALAAKETVRAADLEALRAAVTRLADAHGRVTPALQEALFAAEEALRPRLDAGAARAFQTLVAAVGGKVKGPIHIPEIRVPYWMKDDAPGGSGESLAGFRSSERLPERAEYVLIGAGLTGASAARSLVPEARAGKRVIVLEMGDRPACGASGRNGGNVEMLKESFLEDYRGFVEVQKDLLRHRFPGLRDDVADARAAEQARCLLRFFQANVREIRETVAEYGIDADLSMAGWLRIAETPEEEAGLEAEVRFAKGLGIDFDLWSPERIEQEVGIRTDRMGRFIAESGNYHPYKFVHAVLRRALAEGVLLYTGVRVKRLDRSGEGEIVLHTSDGLLRAAKVIVATNAYTPELLPGTRFVEPRVSHICNFQHVANTFRGRTITRKQGDWYANFPRQDWYEDGAGVPRGTLHVGGGYDTPIPRDEIHAPPFIDLVYHELREDTARILPETRDQPPLRAWSGVMGFTADRAPVLSFLHDRWDGPPDPRVILAVAFNGYGGSQCAAAGKVAASLAVHGAPPPDIDLPDDVFSMRRFLTDEPLFEADRRKIRGGDPGEKTAAELWQDAGEEPMANEITDMINSLPGWVKEMGIVILTASPDEVTCEWQVTEKHHQGYGIVHGGVHCGVVETLASIGAALVAHPRGQRVVGLENSTSFLRAVRSGKLHAAARPVTRGRTSQVWEAWIRDEKDQLVAKGQVRLLCIDETRDLG